MFIEKKSTVKFAAQGVSIDSASSSDEDDADETRVGGKLQVIFENHLKLKANYLLF